MKYSSKTGDYIIANHTFSTSGQLLQEDTVKFVKNQINFTNIRAVLSNDHEKEEFTKEQEKTFYKKVFKTSLV